MAPSVAASRAACLDVDPQLETQWTTLINSKPVPPDIDTGAMTVYVAAAPEPLGGASAEAPRTAEGVVAKAR